MNDLISVIVPVYNNENFLERCLTSLITQKYENIEIILVDDGSTDKSGMICDFYASKDNRIKVIHQKNQGVSKARNEALKISTGKYLAFCDSDDFVELGIYEELINSLKSSDYGISMCTLEKDISLYDKFSIFGFDEMALKIMSDSMISGYLWNKIFRANIIRENNIQFMENIHILEDQIFVLEYIKHISKGVCVNEKLYNYEMNPNSALNSKISEKKLTALYGRVYIYNIIREYSQSVDLKIISWKQMICELIVFSKKLIFKQTSITNKCKINKYLNEINKYLSKYLNDFDMKYIPKKLQIYYLVFKVNRIIWRKYYE